MHTIFSVASKLLGVYFAYRGLIFLVNTVVVVDGWDETTFIQLLHAALAFVFAFILIRRTDGLAQLVGVSAEASTSIGGLEPETALRTGVVLVGLFVFLTRVGSLLHAVSLYLRGARLAGTAEWPVGILIECVPLALAGFFVLRADRVVDWIVRQKTPAI